MTIISLIVFIISIVKIGSSLATTESFSITNVEISNKSSTVEIKNINQDNNQISNEIIFHAVGDSVTYKITIKNNEDEEYKLIEIHDDNQNESISYEYGEYENKIFAPKQENEIYITAKYVKALENVDNREQQIPVKITLVFVDEEDNEQEEEIQITPTSVDNDGDNIEKNSEKPNVINKKEKTTPKTGDSITMYIVIASISLATLVYINKTRINDKTYAKGKHSLNNRFLVLVISGFIVVPTIVKAISISMDISFINEIKFLDKYVITYNIEGEEEKEIVDYKETINNLGSAEKRGYDFKGWFTEPETGEKVETIEEITEDITLYAHFEVIEYRIDYNLDCGTANNDDHYTVNDEITLNKPEKYGYNFTGWSEGDSEEIIENVTIVAGTIGDKTYTAHYTKKTFTVSFEENGGTEVDDIDKKYNEEIGELPETTKEDYKFEGWYTDENYTTKVETTTKVTESTTYYAKWRELKDCTIIFDPNEGEVNPTSKVVKETKKAGELPKPTRDEYIFRGWYTDLSFENQVTADTIITEDITVHAKWQERMETVYSLAGPVTFTGGGKLSGENLPEELYEETFIDTGIKLFNNENYEKDFEIGFEIVTYVPTENESQGTFVNAKLEDESQVYPGVVVRRNNETNNIEITGRNGTIWPKKGIIYTSVHSVKLSRIDNEVYYSIDGKANQHLMTLDGLPEFSVPTTFGATLDIDGNPMRFLTGTLKNLYIKLEVLE